MREYNLLKETEAGITVIITPQERKSALHTFDDIIGYEYHKQELKTICDILKNPDKYSSMGVRPPHALMIYGKPGLGKTLMAKALIDESGRKCFSCKKSKGKNDFNQDIRDAFDKAAAEAPSIVFLDDMDKFAEDNLDSNSNKEEFATIQSCMEDVCDLDVFVIATANEIRFIPDSLMRPGRFGKQMFVGIPSIDEFTGIAASFLKEVKTADEDYTAYVTRLLSGRSPALLKEAINEAGIASAFRGSETISKADITRAVLNVAFNMREKCCSDVQTSNPEKQRLVSIHEAGHAVVAVAVGRPISIISTIGSGELGGVCMLSEDSNSDLTLDEIEKTLKTLLGERAAVETILGKKEKGVVNDLEQATALLRRSLTEQLMYGFEFGYDLESWDRRGSDARKDAVCQKIYSLLEDYYRSACRIIEENRALIEAVASELAEKSYLTFEDVDRLVGVYKN